jgi:parvulin-like peptidyl-prolyl isomerase
MRNHRHTIVATVVLLIGLGGCQGGSKDPKDKPAVGSNQGSAQGSGPGSAQGSGAGAQAPAPPPKDIDSKDILARTELSPEVYVKNVLIAWKELDAAHHGHLDPRAAKRSNAEAAALAQEIAAKLKADPDTIDALCKESSEDPGSRTGDPYIIKTDTPFVPEFKNLSLRLKEKEAGIVKTMYGYHVIERVAKPPPDPLESVDILARPPEAGPVQVKHVLIGWKDAPSAQAGRADKRAMERTKADADKLAQELLGKVRANADMGKLMKEYSEDPGTKDTAAAYDVSNTTQFVEGFKNLALRLKMNEAGLVKTPFGWHIVKRVPPPPPPPPDSLDSLDILKRTPGTGKVKVKHILLGWTEVHVEDERAKKRDRKTLEKLVKDTVAKLKKGDKIEPLAAELSEDPGSKAGIAIEVNPETNFTPPFKNMALRLKIGEVGTVKTDFGIHIIQRLE